jgi:two-component system phosphate regulon sensor histidine kinase PhoR
VIRKENQRLNLLVEKVLQIARIEKGKVHLKTEPTELNLLLKTVAETFEANHAGKIRINLLLDPAVGKVNADVIHCTNIIHNLLDNAAKYSGEHPEITLGTKRNADSIQVMVRDNGPGIPYQYRNRIFDQFFRIPSGNIHDVKGFGLGLYYVRLTCKAHRWDIRLESESGRGAAFIITIPINNRVEPWKNEQESSM